MNDIVERLRSDDGDHSGAEAADEIERLRERTAIQKQTAKLAGEEIDRLRAQIPDKDALEILIDAVIAEATYDFGVMKPEIEAAIAKLRESLK